jgi:hypothetical protein
LVHVFVTNTDTDQSGQATLDGAGGISGTEDVNHLGALTSDAKFTGTYSVSASGRVTATVTPPGGGTAANVVFYTVLSSKLFLIEVDPGSVGSGVVEKQFQLRFASISSASSGRLLWQI